MGEVPRLFILPSYKDLLVALLQFYSRLGQSNFLVAASSGRILLPPRGAPLVRLLVTSLVFFLFEGLLIDETFILLPTSPVPQVSGRPVSASGTKLLEMHTLTYNYQVQVK
ncbi:hypothetical protein Salat_0448400 [Sesamum alatum]|uniref:Uncharacterized protein n=1 Tax=Sesamum alatum TaxID=300844 RepID=A0AAE1Z2N3_9LAMI|nr:hypothetical protein Salat_0448400 [Sesamum alatum]